MITPPQILIVEDDAVLVIELQETLTKLGYQVVGLAATGKAAVEFALAQKPDLILMDIRLRGVMNGIQAVEQIHQQLDIPVVYLTAFTDEALLQQAKITDAYAYLIKPVRERELRAGLEMALYKHSTKKHLQHLNQILRAVRDVNQLITREHNLQHLLDQACQILLHTHGYRFVWVGQAAGDRLKPLAYAGEGQSLISRIAESATSAQGLKLPGTEAARTRRVVVCYDMLHDERYTPWRKEVEQVHFFSTVAVPIYHEESLYGVLSVYSDQTNIFGSEEIDLLQELAGDIAFGLKAIARETERQIVAESLRESEQKHRLLFETMSQGVVYYNTNGKLISANPAAERILGLPLDLLLGETYLYPGWKIIREDGSELPDEDHPVAITLHTGKSIAHYILGLFNPNTKAYIWLSITSVPLFNPDGKSLSQVYSTFEDITERKQTERALKLSEEKFAKAFRLNPSAIVLVRTRDARVVEINDTFTKAFGYAREEIIGSTTLEKGLWVYPSERDRLLAQLTNRIVLNNIEVLFHTKDQKIITCSSSFEILEIEGELHILAVLEDITERKRSEDALRESEAKFRAVVENSNDGILFGDANAVIQYRSPSYNRINGYTDEERVGRSGFETVHPEDIEELRRYWAKIIAHPEISHRIEYRIRHKDGSWRWIETTGQSLLGNPDVHSVIITSRDVTERKRAEEDRIAREIAEQANRAKSEFLSRMSHELRTPLNAILGFAQLLKMDELRPDQKKGVDQIYKSGRHLLNLVNEVLDIARIESGRLHISPEPVRLADAVQEALDLIRPLAAERNLALSLKLPAIPDVFVIADHQSLRQVLLNLLSNAVKYNRDGGEVAVTTSLTIDGHLRLQVRDSGEGIPPDKMRRLFVPFDRLDRDSIEQEGTGLGLALSKGLVETMGGRIGAQSKLGVGSFFWLELKLASERLTEAILAEVNEHISEQMRVWRGVVMYVEDNLDNLKLVEAIIERLPQIKLISTMQGRLALDLAQQHHPDLILLDLHLPDMPGSEVLSRLKAEAVTQNIPVIILSADAAPERITELLAGGARAYLTKPVDIQELLDVVSESLAELASPGSKPVSKEESL